MFESFLVLQRKKNRRPTQKVREKKVGKGRGREDESRDHAKENLRKIENPVRNLETEIGDPDLVIEIVVIGPNLEIANIANVQNRKKKVGVEVVKGRNHAAKIAVAGQSPVNEIVATDQNPGRKVVEVDQSPMNEFQTGENPTRSSRVSWSPNSIMSQF